MHRLLKLRVLIAVAIGGLALGGCSSDSEPTADPTPASSSSPSSPSTSATPPSGSASEAPAECTVAGFVPRTSIELRKSEPVVVYAHTVTLAAGSGFSSPNLDLGRRDLVPLRVRPDDSSVTLPAGVQRQILASGGGPVEAGAVPDVVRAQVRFKVDAKHDHRYLVYRGSFAYSGDWKVKACGAPYNDGTEVETITGTYATVSRIRPVAVAECKVPASGTALDRYAADLACRDF